MQNINVNSFAPPLNNQGAWPVIPANTAPGHVHAIHPLQQYPHPPPPLLAHQAVPLPQHIRLFPPPPPHDRFYGGIGVPKRGPLRDARDGGWYMEKGRGGLYGGRVGRPQLPGPQLPKFKPDAKQASWKPPQVNQSQNSLRSTTPTASVSSTNENKEISAPVEHNSASQPSEASPAKSAPTEPETCLAAAVPNAPQPNLGGNSADSASTTSSTTELSTNAPAEVPSQANNVTDVTDATTVDANSTAITDTTPTTATTVYTSSPSTISAPEFVVSDVDAPINSVSMVVVSAIEINEDIDDTKARDIDNSSTEKSSNLEEGGNPELDDNETASEHEVEADTESEPEPGADTEVEEDPPNPEAKEQVDEVPSYSNSLQSDTTGYEEFSNPAMVERLAVMASNVYVPVDQFRRFPHEPIYEAMNVDAATLSMVPPEAHIDIALALKTLISDIARRTSLPYAAVSQCLDLMSQGNTIPYIARYMKDESHGLHDTQLREIESLWEYGARVLKYKQFVLLKLTELKKLTPELKYRITTALSCAEVDDWCMKEKTGGWARAKAAAAKGLQPLADIILSQAPIDEPLDTIASKYINAEQKLDTLTHVYESVCDLIAEEIAFNPHIRLKLRSFLYPVAQLRVSRSKLIEDLDREKTQRQLPHDDIETLKKANQYKDYCGLECVGCTLQAPRMLTLNRGEREGFLTTSILFDKKKALQIIDETIIQSQTSEFARHLRKAGARALELILAPRLIVEYRSWLTDEAERNCTKTFAATLYNMMMHPPSPGKVILGIDPGFKEGCKLAVVDGTGKVLATRTIYPHKPQYEVANAENTLITLMDEYRVDIVAIASNSAAKETDQLIERLCARYPRFAQVERQHTTAAGLQEYADSDDAITNLSNIPSSLRTAVTVARRVLDPLQEFAKLDPMVLIGGPNKRDVRLLGTHLRRSMADIVNRVGVDINTTNVHVLSYISGLNTEIAQMLIQHRQQHGPFRSRAQLMDLFRFENAEHVYRQCIGFIRVVPPQQTPLDATNIHPSHYNYARKILEIVEENESILQSPDRERLASKLQAQSVASLSEALGIPNKPLLVSELVSLLSTAWRDPRMLVAKPSTRKQPSWTLDDMQPGKIVVGTVVNVTNFGAFVDIGLKQNAFIHKSEITDKVPPNEPIIPAHYVRVGDQIRAKVLKLEKDKERVTLSIRQADTEGPPIVREENPKPPKPAPKKADQPTTRKMTHRTDPSIKDDRHKAPYTPRDRRDWDRPRDREHRREYEDFAKHEHRPRSPPPPPYQGGPGGSQQSLSNVLQNPATQLLLTSIAGALSNPGGAAVVPPVPTPPGAPATHVPPAPVVAGSQQSHQFYVLPNGQVVPAHTLPNPPPGSQLVVVTPAGQPAPPVTMPSATTPQQVIYVTTSPQQAPGQQQFVIVQQPPPAPSAVIKEEPRHQHPPPPPMQQHSIHQPQPLPQLVPPQPQAHPQPHLHPLPQIKDPPNLHAPSHPYPVPAQRPPSFPQPTPPHHSAPYYQPPFNAANRTPPVGRGIAQNRAPQWSPPTPVPPHATPPGAMPPPSDPYASYYGRHQPPTWPGYAGAPNPTNSHPNPYPHWM